MKYTRELIKRYLIDNIEYFKYIKNHQYLLIEKVKYNKDHIYVKYEYDWVWDEIEIPNSDILKYFRNENISKLI